MPKAWHCHPTVSKRWEGEELGKGMDPGFRLPRGLFRTRCPNVSLPWKHLLHLGVHLGLREAEKISGALDAWGEGGQIASLLPRDCAFPSVLLLKIRAATKLQEAAAPRGMDGRKLGCLSRVEGAGSFSVYEEVEHPGTASGLAFGNQTKGPVFSPWQAALALPVVYLCFRPLF